MPYWYLIDPLQLSIHVAQNRHVGTQKWHWEKTNKGNYHLKLCVPFVGLTLVRLLRPNMAVLYHVNGKLQRAYFEILSRQYFAGFYFRDVNRQI